MTELDQQALDSLVKEMKSIPIPNSHPGETIEQRDLRRMRAKLMQVIEENKALQRKAAEQKTIIQTLEAKLTFHNTIRTQRTIEEWDRLQKLAYQATAAAEGVAYDRSHAVNDLRAQVWDTFAVKTGLGDVIVNCCHCGKALQWVEFTIEHLRPQAMGGSDHISNLRPACETCNWHRPCEDISHLFSGT